jgi:hypothetical protein
MPTRTTPVPLGLSEPALYFSVIIIQEVRALLYSSEWQAFESHSEENILVCEFAETDAILTLTIENAC